MLPMSKANGNFECLPPFDSIINESEVYTVLSTRSIREMIASGADILNDTYLVNGLTKEDFHGDLNNSIMIVIFENSAGKFINVPEKYIVSIPKQTGIEYGRRVVYIDLGAIPNSEDLTGFRDEIVNYTKDRLGIIPNVEDHIRSTDIDISYEENILAMNKRKVLKNKHSNLLELEMARKKIMDLKTKILILAKKIKSGVP